MKADCQILLLNGVIKADTDRFFVCQLVLACWLTNWDCRDIEGLRGSYDNKD